jgi:hypothetical protein
MDKSHIEHSISFIKNKYLDIRERDISLIDEIEKSARSGNEYIDSLPESLNLLTLPNTTEYDRLMKSSISSI